MKVVVIHGQNHKGSTYHIGQMILEQLQCENIKEFFLPKDLNHFCVGCYQCIEDETKCPFYMEKKVLLDAIEEADLLLFTTPTYCMHVSAPMKAFLDLTFTNWMVHKPKGYMMKKKALIISTAAGAGMKGAMKDIKQSLFFWGIPKIYTYGIGVQAMNWKGVSAQKKEKILKDINKLIPKLYKAPKVSIKTKGLFMIMRMIQLKNMGSGETEKNYWKNQGWLGKTRPWKE